MTTRRGFTLIEVLIGLVLTLLVGGVTYQLLNNSQRVSRQQMAQTSMQDAVRSGALVITNELRELGYDNIPLGAGIVGSGVAPNPDLMVIQPGRIEYKATRGTGFTCAMPSTTQIKLLKTTYYGVQTPPAQNDSIALYIEGASNTAGDDAWVHGQITGLVTTGTCVTANDAWVLPVTFPVAYINLGAKLVLGNYVVGGPVRVLEHMEMKYYASNGEYWLGMRSRTTGSQWEPVIGPLSDSTVGLRGLTFTYRDKNNAVTAVLNDVRSVSVMLRGITDQQVRRAGSTQTLVDTLQLDTRVALRNTLRP
jgi:prepilin-type N-terminal cleavage/methylation domain-containing protein